MDWIEFWDTISVLQIVGWILGALGLIAFAVKGWPTVKKFVAFVDALFSLPAFIARTDKTLTEQNVTLTKQNVKIEQIHHEVNYNNGSSVKDAVARVELGVKSLHDKVNEQKIALDKADDDLRHELEKTRPPARKPRTPRTKE